MKIADLLSCLDVWPEQIIDLGHTNGETARGSFCMRFDLTPEQRNTARQALQDKGLVIVDDLKCWINKDLA